MKKLAALLMAVAMVLSIVPFNVLAATDNTTVATQHTETVTLDAATPSATIESKTITDTSADASYDLALNVANIPEAKGACVMAVASDNANVTVLKATGNWPSPAIVDEELEEEETTIEVKWSSKDAAPQVSMAYDLAKTFDGKIAIIKVKVKAGASGTAKITATFKTSNPETIVQAEGVLTLPSNEPKVPTATIESKTITDTSADASYDLALNVANIPEAKGACVMAVASDNANVAVLKATGNWPKPAIVDVDLEEEETTIEVKWSSKDAAPQVSMAYDLAKTFNGNIATIKVKVKAGASGTAKITATFKTSNPETIVQAEGVLTLPQAQGCAHTNLSSTAAVAATCKAGGNIAYWYCADCQKYFSDAQATTEITQAQTVTEKDSTNHTGGTNVTGKVAATCKSAGYTGDTYCLGCEKKIASGEATGLNAANHSDLKSTAAKASTCKTAGNIAYWYCSGCSKYYSDAAAKTEITQAATVAELDSTNHETTNTHNVGYVASTCKTAGATGAELYDCCNAVKTASTSLPLDPNNHETTNTNLVGAITATCKTEGYTGDTCYACCGAVKTAGSSTGLDATNHETTDTHISGAQNATCGVAGSTGDVLYDCCNGVKTAAEVIPATGLHKWNAGEREGDYILYTCTVCENTKKVYSKISVGGSDYLSIEEAIADMKTGDVMDLEDDLDLDVKAGTVTEGLKMNMNGHNVTGTINMGGQYFYGFDTTNGDFEDHTDCAVFSATIVNGQMSTTYTASKEETGAGKTMRFVAIPGDKGTWTFHRFYVEVNTYSLDTDALKLGFKAQILGDSAVIAYMDADEAFNFEVWAEDENGITQGSPASVALERSNLKVGSEGNTVQGYINLKDGTKNKIKEAAAKYILKAQISINLGGETVYGNGGEPIAFSVREFMSKYDDKFNEHTYDNQLALYEFYVQNKDLFKDWGLSNIAKFGEN